MVCPIVPINVQIVDRDVNPNSSDDATIRFQVQYRQSNALTLLSSLGQIDPDLATISAQYAGQGGQRGGIAHLHYNDVTG